MGINAGLSWDVQGGQIQSREDGRARKTRFIDTTTRERATRDTSAKGKRRRRRGGKVVPPCIFGGTLLPPLARDVSTRTTIPTSKCTPNGRLHSCIKKKKKGKKKVVEEREKEGKKKRSMLDDILTRHMAFDKRGLSWHSIRNGIHRRTPSPRTSTVERNSLRNDQVFTAVFFRNAKERASSSSSCSARSESLSLRAKHALSREAFRQFLFNQLSRTLFHYVHIYI